MVSAAGITPPEPGRAEASPASVEEETPDLTAEMPPAATDLAAADPEGPFIEEEAPGEIEIEPEPPVDEPEPAPIEPLPVLGWCCFGGEVGRSAEPDCRERLGVFFKGRHAATAACLIVGCCVDGGFKLGETRERCAEQGGAYMSAGEVPLRCRAP